MSFEENIAKLNELFFFREFTFSETTFRPTTTREIELADNVIWLDELLIVFQLKEREASNIKTSEDEKQWFDNKVRKKATKQIRDTLQYLETNNIIELQNHRGHYFNLTFSKIRSLHKLVVYLPNELLPEELRRVKYHRSRTAGIIHLLAANDYLGIVQTLITPAEVADYLNFREALIQEWQEAVFLLPEQALVGQYLSGELATQPRLDFLEYLNTLRCQTNEWDMSGVIKTFPNHITSGNSPTDYYFIVKAIARLNRNELREFKKRFQLSVTKAKANEFELPYRIACPRTDCGFVFVPLTKDVVSHRNILLKNFTLLHKYDQRMSKCLGVSLAPEGNGWFSAEWCYLEFPWTEEPILANKLQHNNPFREVKPVETNRYKFRE